MTQSPCLPLALDERGLEAATDAVTREIRRYWEDDTVEAGHHEPVAAAAVRAYLSAVPASLAVKQDEDRS